MTMEITLRNIGFKQSLFQYLLNKKVNFLCTYYSLRQLVILYKSFTLTQTYCSRLVLLKNLKILLPKYLSISYLLRNITFWYNNFIWRQ